jgi:hypothetical protein
MINSTSRMAFEKLLDQLSNKRGQVFAEIWAAAEPISDYQISRRLHWPQHCVTPRRGELEAMGYIESAFVAVGEPNAMEVHFWKVTEAAMQGGFEPRPLLKYERQAKVRTQPMTVHEAARIMAEWRKLKRKKMQDETATPLFI